MTPSDEDDTSKGDVKNNKSNVVSNNSNSNGSSGFSSQLSHLAQLLDSNKQSLVGSHEDTEMHGLSGGRLKNIGGSNHCFKVTGNTQRVSSG